MNDVLKTEIDLAVNLDTKSISLADVIETPIPVIHTINRPALLDALRRIATQAFEVEYEAAETLSEINAISLKVIALQKSLRTITPDIPNQTARYTMESTGNTTRIPGDPTAQAAILLGKQIYHAEQEIAAAQNELQKATTRYDSLQHVSLPFTTIFASLAPWEQRIVRLRYGGASDRSEQGYVAHRNSGGGLRYTYKQLSYREIGDDAAVLMDSDTVRENAVRVALAFMGLYLPSERAYICGCADDGERVGTVSLVKPGVINAREYCENKEITQL